MMKNAMSTQGTFHITAFLTTDRQFARKWPSCTRPEFMNDLQSRKNVELVCPQYGAQYGQVKDHDGSLNSAIQFCLAIIDSPLSKSVLYLTDLGFSEAQLHWQASAPRLTIDPTSSRTSSDQKIHLLETKGLVGKGVQIQCPRYGMVVGILNYTIINWPNEPLLPARPTDVLAINSKVGQQTVSYYLTQTCDPESISNSEAHLLQVV
jgi:hypothetical protein